MEPYLQDFRKELESRWKGSLVKAGFVRKPRAKEYLNRLARAGAIEKVTWGWYWIPVKVENVQDFLRRDRNFKVISDQTAASFWNGDFVHRDIYIVKVRDRSYGRALEKFGEKRRWNIKAKYTDERLAFKNIDGLRVESMEQTVIDCLKDYAFEDAFATMYANKDRIAIGKMKRKHYWGRLPRSGVRIRQILEYGWARLTGKYARKIGDDYIKRNVDDALDKVIAFG